jgi:hypothetical protein
LVIRVESEEPDEVPERAPGAGTKNATNAGWWTGSWELHVAVRLLGPVQLLVWHTNRAGVLLDFGPLALVASGYRKMRPENATVT